MYIAAQCPQDTAPDTTFGTTHRYLELDFDQVEWVFAEHSDCTCADTGERMVLEKKKKLYAIAGCGVVVTRMIAWVRRKLGWEKGEFGMDMRCYGACR
jgi:hypothetical protein